MAAEQPFAIEVAGLDGAVHKVSQGPAGTVADVKRSLSESAGKPASCLTLLWGTRVLGDGEAVGSLGLPREGACLTLLVRRERLALSGDKDGELRLWSADSGACVRALPRLPADDPAAVRAICACWEQMLALCGFADGRLQLWDLSGFLLRTLGSHSKPVRGLAVDWAGSVALSGSQDACAKLWDLNTGQCLQSWDCGNPVYALAADWAGSRALRAHEKGTLCLWDLRAEEGADLRTYAAHTRHVLALAVDWSAARALTGSVDCRMRLLDLDSGECLRTFVVKDMPRRGDGANAVAMDWSRQRAVSGSGAGIVQLWDLGTGNCLSRLEDPVGCPVCAVVLLDVDGPDGTGGTVLTGSSDKRVRLWDFGRAECVKVFTGHTAPILAMAA